MPATPAESAGAEVRPAPPAESVAAAMAAALLREARARHPAPPPGEAAELQRVLVAALCQLLDGELHVGLDDATAARLQGLGLAGDPQAARDGVLATDRTIRPEACKPLALDAGGHLWLASQAGRGLALLDALHRRVAAGSRARPGPGQQGSRRQNLGQSPSPRQDPGQLAPLRQSLEAEQEQALDAALSSDFCLVHGGPGTGKTTVVVRMAAALVLSLPSPCRVVLAAPTGRAARRLGEALARDQVVAALPRDVRPSISCTTLHRLLGARRDGGFWRGPRNRVLADALLVDEGSMVSLDLAWALVSALPPSVPLALIGDERQLPPVDFGRPFGDLVRDDKVAPVRVHLKRAHRFAEEGGLGDLATAVRDEPRKGLEMLRRGGRAWEWLRIPADQPSPPPELAARLAEPWVGNPPPAQALPTPLELEAWLQGYRILCALRVGPWGADRLNAAVQRYLQSQGALPRVPPGEGLPPGTPVMVQANNPSLGLYNGDMGAVLPREPGEAPRAAFPQSAAASQRFAGTAAPATAGAPSPPAAAGIPPQSADASEADPGDGQSRLALRVLPLDILPPHQAAWAISVHRAQGSEYERVSVLVNPEEEGGDREGFGGLELLYTALTRARRGVLLAGPESRVESQLLREDGGDAALLRLREA